MSEGSEPSLSFNFVTAASFCADVILLKKISGERGVASSTCRAAFPFRLIPPARLPFSLPCFPLPRVFLSRSSSITPSSMLVSGCLLFLVFRGLLVVATSSTFEAVRFRFFVVDFGGIWAVKRWCGGCSVGVVVGGGSEVG